MKCLICKDDPNAKKTEKDWNEDMDERKLAQHIVRAHFVDSLEVAQYLAKLHKIELTRIINLVTFSIVVECRL
jgi:disulfide oxidoreductase YuzD